MSGLATRLLLLGVTHLFEPVNGYQIRRELLTWQVESWANVNPGSIYHGLSQLTKQGMLERSDLPDGERTVAVYTTTEAGRREFQRLYATALTTLDYGTDVDFTAAFTLQNLVTRTTFLDLLRQRRTIIAKTLSDPGWQAKEDLAPPHVLEMPRLWTAQLRTANHWLDEMIAKVEDGQFAFAGEPQWQPPAEDSGWEMEEQRQRYRHTLDGRSGRPHPS